MKINLQRLYMGRDCTIGTLEVDGRILCYTLEDPWLNNRPLESCIAAGEYNVDPFSGDRYQNVWQVQDVPGRSAILIHVGNTALDTQGCILVGKVVGELKGMRAVLHSARTLSNLKGIIGPNSFILHVRNI